MDDVDRMKELLALVNEAFKMFEDDPGISIHDVAERIQSVLFVTTTNPAPLLALAVAEMACAQHQGDWA